jgi:protein HIRA/HIR1
MLSCSNAVVYTYDLSLKCFTKLTDRWWAEGSEAWQKQRSAVMAGGNGGKGLVAYVEGYCNNTPVAESHTTTAATNTGGGESSEGAGDDKSRPQWWSEALTLGHLETRMYAAKMLDSPVEYKQALLAYARRIADEGFRWKAEELARELFGPIYWCVFTFSLCCLKRSVLNIVCVGVREEMMDGLRQLRVWRRGIY